MSEKLNVTIERNDAQRQAAIAQLGARACNACPVLQLGACAGKENDAAPCPPKAEQTKREIVANVGGNAGSYRSQLADKSTSAVWAKLQPIVKPETIAPKKPITPPRKNPVREAHVTPPSVPARPLPPRVVPRQKKPISQEVHSLGDAVADLAALIIPVKALGRALKK